MAETKRRAYQAAYRDTLEEQDTQVQAQEPDPISPEENSWKKRYGDLRSYNNNLNNRVKELETQLNAANQKEIKLPSTKQELEAFAQRYPDVFRHIRSVALTELVQERENITSQTKVVAEELEQLKRDRGLQKILSVHKDFNEINNSEAFHAWAETQPKNIQDWVYEDADPDLCIRAIDLYKADMKVKQPVTPPRQRADVQVRTRGTIEVPDASGDKRLWKASEIAKLHPKQFEAMEAEIEAANREGRIDLSA